MHVATAFGSAIVTRGWHPNVRYVLAQGAGVAGHATRSYAWRAVARPSGEFAAWGAGGFLDTRRLLSCTALVPVAVLLLSGLAMANPQGGRVVAGNVNMGASGSK